MLASLLCLQLKFPWQLGGILFTAAGLVVGVAAIRQVLRAGMRGSLVVSLGVGLGLAAFMLLGQLAMLAFWPASSELQACRSEALTLRAQEQCQHNYERWIKERTQLPAFGSVRGS
jgi:hypothetical protein